MKVRTCLSFAIGFWFIFSLFFLFGSVAIAASPVTDSFDPPMGYQNWLPFETNTVPFVKVSGAGSGCFSGGCITTGTLYDPRIHRAYLTGVALSEGNMTFFARRRVGFSGGTSGTVLICVGAPTTTCDGWGSFAP